MTATFPLVTSVARVRAAPTLVVAIGAADGGLDALKAFFIGLDETAGMAFIVLQHGEPGSRPNLPAILMQFTDLPVHEIRDGLAIAPDQVFVAPPGATIELEGARFAIRQLSSAAARRSAIDLLFRSVADSVGARAVGVILPGNGRDGTAGVRRIAAVGGLTLAYDARTNETDMPRSAIATGAVDSVLAPILMPGKLLTRLGRSEVPVDASAMLDLKLSNNQLLRLRRELIEINGKLQAKLQERELELRELSTRYDSLARAHTHLSDLLCNTATAILFLDAHERVEGFTPHVGSIFDLDSTSIGRPLGQLGHHAHEMPPLPALSTLAAHGGEQEDDVVTRQRWYIRRTLLRHNAQGQVDGLIAAFIDVTSLKSSEANARPHEEELRSITDAMPTIISYVDDAVHCI